MMELGLGEKMKIAERQVFDFSIKYFNETHFSADLASIVLENVKAKFERMAYEDTLLRAAVDLDEEASKPIEVKGTVDDLKEALSEMGVTTVEH